MRWTAFLLAAFLAVPVWAASPKDTVNADLLADTSAIKAGQPITIAIQLTIAPGWHIYWKNPGDAGLATSVNWTLPPGFTASELQFPTPTQFNQPGNVIGYGYENSVTLLATITPPAELKEKTATLICDVSWLVCKDVCVPGKIKKVMVIPVSDKPLPTNTKLIDAARNEIPQPPPADLPVKIALSPKEESSIIVTWPTAPKTVQFFPAPGGAQKVSDIQIATEGKQTTIRFHAVQFPTFRAQPFIFPVVIAYTDEAGVRHAIEMKLDFDKAGR